MQKRQAGFVPCADTRRDGPVPPATEGIPCRGGSSAVAGMTLSYHGLAPPKCI